MPIRDIDRVVMVMTSEERGGAKMPLNGTSRPNFEDLRAQNVVFSHASLFGGTPLAVSGGGEPEQIFGEIVSGSYFDVLGPHVAAGRVFGPDDDRDVGGSPVTESATLSTALPMFSGGFARTTFRDDQDITDPRNGRLTQVNEVADRYFETLGIPIVRGRAFTAGDRVGSPPVVIINEAMAKQFFPNEEALGRRLHIFNRPPAREIVGIARNIKYNSVGENETTYMYLPLEQNYASQVMVQVRGVVVGLVLALALARLVTNLLFGVSGADPVTFVGVPVLFLAMAAAATLLPARRASRVDPVEALRT